jgi:formamidopyrimidine-DNA glycosylase
MPELPEVEIARRCLERWVEGRRVRRIEVVDARVVAGGGAALAPLEGARAVACDRHGKHLLLTFEGPRGSAGLWAHLGMTGKWVRRRAEDEAPRFSRVRWDLDDGTTLHYLDLRLFGRLRLVPEARFTDVPELAALGPDPLHDGVDPGWLEAALARVRLPIKVALMDQRLVAGVGNIQSSEALFRAALDPRRPAREVPGDALARLGEAVLASVAHTLEAAGLPALTRGDRDMDYVEEPGTANPFLVYGRAGAPCPRCPGGTGTIVRIVQAGRSTFFCERCQG